MLIRHPRAISFMISLVVRIVDMSVIVLVAAKSVSALVSIDRPVSRNV